MQKKQAQTDKRIAAAKEMKSRAPAKAPIDPASSDPETGTILTTAEMIDFAQGADS